MVNCVDTLDGLKAVIAVVETGSFTAASERLDASKALISKYISEVEDRLGVRLFNRTTRKVSLTEVGSRYYSHALQMLDNYQAMVDDVVGEQGCPKGLLRVSAPVSFGERQLAALIPEFCSMYPDLKFELLLNNRAVDMVEEGIDIRIKIGLVEDSNMIARHIYDVPLIMCASPDYLAQHGVPSKPKDLAVHQCISDSNFKMGQSWTLYAEDGHKHVIEIKSKVSANSPQAVANIAKAGGGIGIVTEHVIKDDIEKGHLISVLPTYLTLKFGLYLMYPHRKHVSSKIKCFVAFVQDKFLDM